MWSGTFPKGMSERGEKTRTEKITLSLYLQSRAKVLQHYLFRVCFWENWAKRYEWVDHIHTIYFTWPNCNFTSPCLISCSVIKDPFSITGSNHHSSCLLTVKMLYLIGPDELVNWRFVNFQKIVWMTTAHVLRFRINLRTCTIVIHTIFWKFSKFRLTSPSGPNRYNILS